MKYFFSEYLEETKKSYYSILFLLPFLFFYEYVVISGLNAKKINFGDAVLRFFYNFTTNFLGSIATTIIIALVILALIGYFIKGLVDKKINIRPQYLLLMLGEVMVLVFFYASIYSLFFRLQLPDFFSFTRNPSAEFMLTSQGIPLNFFNIIFVSIGAGIFEELIFRVLGIRIFYELLKKDASEFAANHEVFMKAAFLVSIPFVLIHLGSIMSPFSLIGIFINSLFLSYLYLTRGYGVAAGFHIFWDIFIFTGII